MRTLAARADAPAPWELLARLPAAVRPVLLLDAAGGRSVLTWDPDEIRHGRLRPRGAEPRGGPAGRWPLAEQDPARELERAWAGERWEDEEGGAGPAWIGWFAAGCAHAYEPYPWAAPDPSGLPDWSFARYRRAVCWDPGGGARLRAALAAEEDGAAWREEFDGLCGRPAAEPEPRTPPPALAPERPGEDFRAAVARLRGWIGAGELFQANLSHAVSGPAGVPPRALFARVARGQPTRHGAYWEGGAEAGGAALLSHSPELFLRVRGAALETRPIKGTAPRGADPAADARAAAALDADAKEQAELAMIVDVARNDLGRVACAGGVEVASAGEVETFPTLFHRAATVRARWDPALGFARLWRAVFPPASVTGAPKVRALRAIAELEGEERGPYCGALGWWRPGPAPQGEFSVLIRTAVQRDGRLRLRVGAGVVWDSDPEREWRETLLKARYWSTLPA